MDTDKLQTMGISLTDAYNTLQTFLGGLYVNDFNQFGHTWQVLLQAEPEFRDQPSDRRPLLRAQFERRHGAAAHAGHDHAFGRPRRDLPLQPLPRDPDCWALRRRATPAAQASNAMEEVAAASCRRASATNGPAPPTRRSRRRVTRAPSSASRRCWCSSSWPRSTKAGRFRLRCCSRCRWECSARWPAVYLRSYPYDIYTQIGIVTLIGLAAKNAILIVEFAKESHEHGKSVRDAAIEAAHLRLRPILMTSFAFILGVLPLVLAIGRKLRRAPVARHRGIRRNVVGHAAGDLHRAGALRDDRELGGAAASRRAPPSRLRSPPNEAKHEANHSGGQRTGPLGLHDGAQLSSVRKSNSPAGSAARPPPRARPHRSPTPSGRICFPTTP